MQVKIYYMDTANVPHLMCVYKTDLLYGNRNLQVGWIDETAALSAGYTGLTGVVVKKLNYSFQDLVNIVKAAHTQAFANATNKGFKLTAEDEINPFVVIINTKTT